MQRMVITLVVLASLLASSPPALAPLVASSPSLGLGVAPASAAAETSLWALGFVEASQQPGSWTAPAPYQFAVNWDGATGARPVGIVYAPATPGVTVTGPTVTNASSQHASGGSLLLLQGTSLAYHGNTPATHVHGVSGGSSRTLANPTGMQAGDLVAVYINTANTMAAPAGWTLQRQDEQGTVWTQAFGSVPTDLGNWSTGGGPSGWTYTAVAFGDSGGSPVVAGVGGGGAQTSAAVLTGTAAPDQPPATLTPAPTSAPTSTPSVTATSGTSLPTSTPSPTPNSGGSPSPTSTPEPSATPSLPPVPTPSPDGAPVLAAAGDIACDPANPYFNGGLGVSGLCQARATSDLLVNRQPGLVLPLGDTQYDGQLAAFRQSYDPTWGRLKAVTRPVVGNAEYHVAGASDYFTYFGQAAGDPTLGYYSFDLGAWHIIVLNGNCWDGALGAQACAAGSVQEQWLRADLAAHPADCTLAAWHQPRFSSGSVHASDATYEAFWRDLYAAGVDVVLGAHNHAYERFAPQDPTGGLDTARGIREFVVGSGGASLYGFGAVQPNSEVRYNGNFGVLFLTLHPASYDWEYEAIAGAPSNVVDAGSASCVSRASPTPSPSSTPTPVSADTATTTVTEAPTH